MNQMEQSVLPNAKSLRLVDAIYESSSVAALYESPTAWQS